VKAPTFLDGFKAIFSQIPNPPLLNPRLANCQSQKEATILGNKTLLSFFACYEHTSETKKQTDVTALHKDDY